MQRLKLRGWQQRFIDRALGSKEQVFLLSAWPGSGKTLAVLALFYILKSARRANFLVVTVPTDNLRTAWAASAAKVGLKLRPVTDGRLRPDGYDGIVITYAQLPNLAISIRLLCNHPGRKVVAVPDEIHHAAGTKTWGESMAKAFSDAWRIIPTTGTPFRSDGNRIAMLNYEGGVYIPDFEYTYAEALRDHVCRPVKFAAVDGSVKFAFPEFPKRVHEWRMSDSAAGGKGKIVSARLKGALDSESGIINALLVKGVDELSTHRADLPGAKGLIVCEDISHANAVATILAGIAGEKPHVITSDVSSADDVRKFEESSAAWCVSVRMISEGTNIPALRTLVYLTNYSTFLFFVQALGRVIRVLPDEPRGRTATVVYPADHRFTAMAERVMEMQRHNAGETSAKKKRKGKRKPQAEELIAVGPLLISSVFDYAVEFESTGNAAAYDPGAVVEQVEVVPEFQIILQLRKETAKLANQLAHIISETPKAVHGIWISKFRGQSAADASRADLERKLAWLRAQIASHSARMAVAASVPPGVDRPKVDVLQRSLW